ncbi:MULTISPECIES: hypothetical protein [unclassified Chelatococcus]|uniref:hypothetical protein n=1 Tax=unclassified Chelatococcus TaxID=2638111 RepID=UPI0002E48CAB|nr:MULTISPECIES: hypothetical protein [unclassified Chelatococcus]ALA16107.1 hypothetical protein AL346_00230 [Chelatococcus sp. CO-6]
MTIKLEITAAEGPELAQKLLGTLGAFAFAGREARVTPPPQAAEPAQSAPAPETAEEAKPRRTRKPKDEAAVAEPVPEAEAKPEEKFEAPAAEPEEATAYTADDCRAKLMEVCKRLAPDIGVALFKKHLPKVEKPNISALAPGQYADFIGDADKALEALAEVGAESLADVDESARPKVIAAAKEAIQ